MNAQGREGNVNANRMESRLRCTLAMLAALTTMWLCAVPAWAQSQSASKPVPATKAAPPAAHQAEAVRSSDKGLNPNQGLNTGIKVHGHWVIEVKEPDGKLVSHTEFENSLQQGGQFALAALLSGYSPGDWEILLDGGAGQEPCTNSYRGSGVGPCGVVESGDYFLTSTCPALGEQCFPTLKVSNPISSSGGNLYQTGILTLTGTATAGASGVISAVTTLMNVCYPSSTPTACQTGSGFVTGGSFTGTILPTANTPTTPCGGANQVSCAVPVTAGQTINVSVAISFQ